MATAHAIDVKGLIREYKRGPRAVDGIDLHVHPGEIYGFLGPNGAGKSTTVKMLVTLLPPSGGVALVGGFDVARQGDRVRKLIGVALQEAALDPLLTARELLHLQAGLHGFSKADARVRADQLLERVALSGAAERRVGTYSGGMRRRLDLALALVHNPSILFLDEPTTGLDPQSRMALWEEVRRLAKEEGVTVFLTTQYLEEADTLADRVGIIERGHIVAEGTPAALKSEIGRPTVEVTPTDDADRPRAAAILARFGEPAPGPPSAVAVRLRESAPAIADIVRALDAERVVIANLVLHEPTLDDVFLIKTGRSLEGGTDEPEPEPEVEANVELLREAVAGRSRIEQVPTWMLKDWMAERKAHKVVEAGAPTLLYIREGPHAGASLSVDGQLVVGREGTDFVIPDAEVSRRHAVFHVTEGSLVIQDLLSLNGTWVNGQRITAPTLLAPGDVITLGKTLIEVRPKV